MAMKDRSRFTAVLSNTLHNYGFTKNEIADVILFCYTLESLRVLDLKLKQSELPPSTETIDFHNRSGKT